MIRPSWAIGLLTAAGMLAGFGVAGPAKAQGMFDCRRAAEPYQRTVCADGDLRAADQRLYLAFSDALDVAEQPNGLRSEQSEWTQNLRNCSSDTLCLRDAYSDRTNTLRDRTARATRASAVEPDSVVAPSAPGRPPEAVRAEASSPSARSVTLSADAPAPVDHATPVDNSAEPLVTDQTNEAPAYTGASSPETYVETAAATPTPASEPIERNWWGSAAVGGGVLLVILAIVGSLLATRALARSSMQRYGWPMILNWWNVLHVVAGFALWLGAATGNPIIGLVVAAGLWLTVTAVNIRRTDLTTGILMSLVQPFVVSIVFVALQLARYKPKPYDYVNKA